MTYRDPRYRLSTDMSEFCTKEERPDEWAETRKVWEELRNSVVDNHKFWLERRKRGQQRVQRYQNMYGRKRLY